MEIGIDIVKALSSNCHEFCVQ